MDGDVVDSNLSRQMAEREAAITKMTLMVCIIFSASLVIELVLFQIYLLIFRCGQDFVFASYQHH